MKSIRLLTVFLALVLGFSFSAEAAKKKAKTEQKKAEVMESKTETPAAEAKPTATDEKSATAEEAKPAAETTTVTIKTEAANEKFEDVTLLSKANLELPGSKAELSAVSHGLRKKAVFGLVPVRVYVLELLASNASKLDKTEEGFLKSLPASGPVMLHITFLRDLPGNKISDAFKEGLESNGIKTLTPELEKVLKEISEIKEFKKNESFSIAISWKEKEATVYMQQTGREIKSVAGAPEFAENFLSIWFGKPSDSRLGDLKKSLVK